MYKTSNPHQPKEDGRNKERNNRTRTETFQHLREQKSVCDVLGDGVDGALAVENRVKFTHLQIDSFRFMNLKCIPFHTVFYNDVVWITTCHLRFLFQALG